MPPSSARSPNDAAGRDGVVRQFPVGRESLDGEPETPTERVLAALRGRFRIPAILLCVAIGLTLVDLAVAHTYGAPLSLGPVRAFWLAGPLALIGSVMLVWKIVAEDDDG